MRNCFCIKTKSSKHFWKESEKVQNTNPTNYNYQNTKNAVLGGFSINKHWICTDRFTCCNNFAMARVLTSNGYEYSASLLCYYLMRGISINKQWICPGTFACCYLLHGISINKQWICISKVRLLGSCPKTPRKFFWEADELTVKNSSEKFSRNWILKIFCKSFWIITSFLENKNQNQFKIYGG